MIDFRDVSYVYSPKSPYECLALKEVNFSLSNHEFLFIVGETGSGKSTLIQHLNGLLIPTSGEVQVDEYCLTNNRKRATKKILPLRKKVGVVFQFAEKQLFQDSVEKDVAFGPLNFKIKEEEAFQIAHRALRNVGLDESYDKRSPFELSGGEKKKVAIAGILALNPDVLVLDEPTSGLDNLSKKEMMDLFNKLYRDGKSIIIVTHDMELVLEYAEKVLVLNDGKIVLNGCAHDLFYGVEKFNFLELPKIITFVKALKEKYPSLAVDKIKNLPTLVEEIKRLKGK